MLTAYLLTSLALLGVTVLAGLPDHPYAALLQRTAAARGLDPELVAAVIEVESGFNPFAVSAKGARGLMQIIPSTWRELNPASSCAGDHPPPACGRHCIFDPTANLESGTRHLRTLLDRFGGDAALALAAYNAGQAAVERAAPPGEQGAVPALAETRRYVAGVLDLWTRGQGGEAYRKARNLRALLAVSKWLLAVDGLALGAAMVARPSWAGGVRG